MRTELTFRDYAVKEVGLLINATHLARFWGKSCAVRR